MTWTTLDVWFWAGTPQAEQRDRERAEMSWMDLKFGAALAMGGTVTAYAIAQQDAGFVLVGLGMIAASTVVWAAYRRGERGRHQEARDTADAALPRPANTIWLTFFVLLMVFMAWTIYRFQY